MPNTPSQRTTRSNSNTQNITLHDIKTLIENSKTEIVTSISCEIVKLKDTIGSLVTRIESIEKHQHELEARCKLLEEKANKGRLEREEMLNEVEDRHAKRKFLIISGIPEYQYGDLTEKKDWDTNAIKSMMSEIGIDHFVPKEVARIGRSSEEKP